jgi:hypothetical protein
MTPSQKTRKKLSKITKKIEEKLEITLQKPVKNLQDSDW